MSSHTDDVKLGTGDTIARFIDENREVYMVRAQRTLDCYPQPIGSGLRRFVTFRKEVKHKDPINKAIL